MKTIQKSILISLVPLLTPLTLFADQHEKPNETSALPDSKSSAASSRASEIMGLNIKNANDETIGDVEDLLLDMRHGKVLAVVISSGGFLGIGDTLSVVPMNALKHDLSSETFKTKLTKEQLSAAPQFQPDAWPNYNEAGPLEAIRSFGASLKDDVTNWDKDNQKRQVRDENAQHSTAQKKASRDKSTSKHNEQNKEERYTKEVNQDQTNPTDQGSSDKDVQLSKDIRSSIMDADLSFNAKNIKIVTNDEHVTLNGQVDSDTEHKAILKIAQNHANEGKITDHLKVASK